MCTQLCKELNNVHSLTDAQQRFQGMYTDEFFLQETASYQKE